jgi:hypothetical protein
VSEYDLAAQLERELDRYLGRPAGATMLLGTFHFHNPGLDAFKPAFTLDVFTERRQREIAEVVQRLAAFGPTRVAVETAPSNQEYLDRRYAAYLRDAFELPANEIFQLGFRLARRLAHPRVYAVDAADRHYQPRPDPEAYANEHGQADRLGRWWPRYERLLQQDDAQNERRTLTQMLLRLNEPEAVLRGHGMYLVDQFTVGQGDDYPGADRVTAWYNRNLRIFANLQRIAERPEERLLVIIGAGHLPILRHCVQASPEYALVEVADYLGSSDSSR